MSDPQHELKVWLAERLEAKGRGARTALAVHMGLKPDAITRMTNLDSTKEMREIKAHEVSQMVEFFKSEPPAYRSKPIVASFDPDTHEDHEHDPDWQEQSAALIDGQVRFDGTIPGSTPEVGSRPGAGLGQHDSRQARIVSQGIASGHEVVSEWVIPPAYVRHTLDAQPSGIIIMAVVGHSMEPLLIGNDRILVDTSQNVWLGDAIYVIDDGDGVLQVKTLRKVTSSNPAQFKVVSEAYPDEETLRKVDEFRIVGRVVGRFTGM